MHLSHGQYLGTEKSDENPKEMARFQLKKLNLDVSLHLAASGDTGTEEPAQKKSKCVVQ